MPCERRCESCLCREDTLAATVVSLTYDDGPNEGPTAAILDVLEARGVRATFFVFGTKARERPELIRRMVAAGHDVDPHTWADHRSQLEMSRAELEDDLSRTLAVLDELGAPPPRHWRPPFGDVNEPLSHEVAAAHGLRVVTWTLDTVDWNTERTADLILSEVGDDVRPDSVILMHDVPETPRLTAGLLDRIEARGYETGLLPA
jgi:peptidoglycan/xylan/chitin deacetylase (PgdA/CDA1 family)